MAEQQDEMIIKNEVVAGPSSGLMDELTVGVLKQQKGKAIKKEQKTLAFNIYVSHTNKGENKSQSVKHTASETGLSERSIWSIVKEQETSGSLSSPPTKKPRATADEKLNEEQKSILRGIVHSFFFNNENPSLMKIMEAMRQNKILPIMGRTTLWKVLKKLGFEHEKKGTITMPSPITISMICSIFKEHPSELEEGENSYRCGNVVSMTFNGDVQPHILKGEVYESLKENKYSVDISLNLTDGIVQGRCSCPNGQSICHHMAALILNAHYNIVSTLHNECKWKIRQDDDAESIETIADIFPLEYPTYKAIKHSVANGEMNKFKQALGIESKTLVSNESDICPTEFISIENTSDFVKEEECFVPQEVAKEVVNLASEQVNNSNLSSATKKRKLSLGDNMSVSQRRCVYLHCNKTRRKNPNDHFFTFPVFKDRERCEKWLENCGNQNLLTVNYKKLATLLICQDHFSDASFYSDKKDRLTHNAVPLHYNASSIYD